MGIDTGFRGLGLGFEPVEVELDHLGLIAGNDERVPVFVLDGLETHEARAFGV